MGGLATAGSTVTGADLERAHVVHEARATSAVVVTYDPDRYRTTGVEVADMRPR